MIRRMFYSSARVRGAMWVRLRCRNRVVLLSLGVCANQITRAEANYSVLSSPDALCGRFTCTL